MIKILLIDCNKTIEAKLKRRGFNVISGSMGARDGVRSIPEALYEQDIIIFDPKPSDFFDSCQYNKKNNKGIPELLSIDDITPEIRNIDIGNFLEKGGIIFTFCNPLDVSTSEPDSLKEMAVYSWIPSFPLTLLTKDNSIIKSSNITKEEKLPFLSIFRDYNVKTPALRRIEHYSTPPFPQSLLLNARGNNLSTYYDIDFNLQSGRVVILPQFESNDDVIEHIVSYVYPQLFNIEPDLPKKLKNKKSKKQIELEKVLNSKKDLEKELIGDIYQTQQEILDEANRIEQLIKKNETAQIILNYLNDIYESEQASWHQSYKIAQRLYHEFGGEKEAKKALKSSTEINYIKKITNESGRDTRHPPRKGEAIDPITNEELQNIIKHSESLITRYIDYVINESG